MKNFLYIGFFFFALTGCKPKVPKDIIQPDKMGKILFDIHIIDGYTGTIPKPDSAKKIAASYYKGIYKKFGIDSAVYNKSMDFYYKNPGILNEMYLKIKDTLTQTMTNMEKATTDSLRITAKLKADSALRSNILMKDTIKTKIDVILPKMIYKEPEF